MARHRSPQGRRAHLEFPLSAALAVAGTPGAPAHARSVPSGSSVPARAVATVVAGGALVAAGQQAVAATGPLPADGAAVLAGVVSLLGTPDRSAASLTAPVASATQLPIGTAEYGIALAPADASTAVPGQALAPVVSPEPLIADAATLVKAADLQATAERVAAEAAAAEQAAAASAAERAATEQAAAEQAATEKAAAEKVAAKEAAPAKAGGSVTLVSGRVTSGFGSRWGRAHQGLDIAAPIGTPIRAPLAGTVITSGSASGFGMWVRLKHADGTVTVYGHINRSLVKVGQQVAAGQQIAEVGNRGRSTGPHLHIEVVTPGGKKINPRPWLDQHAIGY